MEVSFENNTALSLTVSGNFFLVRITVQVTSNDGIPEGTGTFTEFGDTCISEAGVAFAGSGDDAQMGVYFAAAGTDSSLACLANQEYTVPSTGTTLTFFSSPDTDDLAEDVVFVAESSDDNDTQVYNGIFMKDY